MVAALGSGLGRTAEAADFVKSAEADRRAAADDYVAILGRQGSSSELDAWVTPLRATDSTLDAVAEALLGSSEFAKRAAPCV